MHHTWDIVRGYGQVLSLSHGIKISSEFAVAHDAQISNDSWSLEPNTRLTLSSGATFTAQEVLVCRRVLDMTMVAAPGTVH